MWTWIPFLYPRRSRCINKGFIYVAQKRTFEHVIFGLDCLKDLYQEKMNFTQRSDIENHLLSKQYSGIQISHNSLSGMKDISIVQPRFISSLYPMSVNFMKINNY